MFESVTLAHMKWYAFQTKFLFIYFLSNWLHHEEQFPISENILYLFSCFKFCIILILPYCAETFPQTFDNKPCVVVVLRQLGKINWGTCSSWRIWLCKIRHKRVFFSEQEDCFPLGERKLLIDRWEITTFKSFKLIGIKTESRDIIRNTQINKSDVVSFTNKAITRKRSDFVTIRPSPQSQYVANHNFNLDSKLSVPLHSLPH